MTDDVRRNEARQLAALLDQEFDSDWLAKPHLAVLRAPSDSNVVDLLEIDEPVTTTIGRLPRAPRAAAAGVTALGHATRATADRGSPVRVRVSVAVTCCDVFSIIRSADGHLESRITDGDLIVGLREWAGLATCSCVAA